MYSLHGEDPELTAKVEQLQALAALDGIVFSTADFGGVRTEADTTRILKYRDDDYAKYEQASILAGKVPTAKEVWRPIAPFGSSFHNYGCARDLRVLKRPDSFSEAEALRRVGTLAQECGLRWGGNFKKRVDPPHVELGITLTQARKRWTARRTITVPVTPPAPEASL